MLRTHRDTLENGPDLPIQHVAGYLAAEVDLGRLPRDLDAEAAARLLLGACFQEAFLASFEERPPRPDLADRLVATLEKLA